MSLILILLAYYFDYKSEKETFKKDLLGGLYVFLAFLIYSLTLKFIFGIHILYIIFSIGIEILLLFSFKAFLNKKN